mgnify:CR=1 FL=1
MTTDGVGIGMTVTRHLDADGVVSWYPDQVVVHEHATDARHHDAYGGFVWSDQVDDDATNERMLSSISVLMKTSVLVATRMREQERDSTILPGNTRSSVLQVHSAGSICQNEDSLS